MNPESLPAARAAAQLLLRFRPRSEKEMRFRLRQKGYDAVVIDALIQELQRKDLINDSRFAQYYAANRLNSRPSGIQALKEEMRRKGLDISTIEKSLPAATEGYDEAAAARELARKRFAHMKNISREAAQRRLFGLLARRGFSQGLVYRVVREVVAESESSS